MSREDGAGPDPVGSVADEAAKLLRAFGTGAGADAGSGAGTGAAEPDDPGPDRAGERAEGSRCAECGADAVPATCRVCPVCRGLALVRSVRPETLDRVADAVGLLGQALHELAGELRGRSGQGRAAGEGRASGGPETAHDIPVTEDDTDVDTGDIDEDTGTTGGHGSGAVADPKDTGATDAKTPKDTTHATDTKEHTQ